jgi:catechol 2,3-dioxygenase-like lactoylglutathione lyase family enzyme
MKAMPTLGRVLESSLYVDRLDVSIDFYQRIFDFKKLVCDNRFCAFDVSGQQVLLLFLKGASTAPMQIPGGVMPPHDGAGQTHLAFTISAADESAWLKHLEAANVAIESRVAWPRGGFSLYFRDPDGNLLELVTPGCWAIY